MERLMEPQGRQERRVLVERPVQMGQTEQVVAAALQAHQGRQEPRVRVGLMALLGVAVSSIIWTMILLILIVVMPRC